MTEIEDICARYKWDVYIPEFNQYLRSEFQTLLDFWNRGSPTAISFVACTAGVLDSVAVRKLCGCMAECVYPYTTSLTKNILS